MTLAWQLWGLLLNFIGWFIKLSVQTFQPLIVIYSNFVYHSWVRTSIYRPLSYLFRSLHLTTHTNAHACCSLYLLDQFHLEDKLGSIKVYCSLLIKCSCFAFLFIVILKIFIGWIFIFTSLTYTLLPEMSLLFIIFG